MSKQTDTYHLTVNGQHSFEIQSGEAQMLNVITQPDGSFHVLKEGKAYSAVLESVDTDSRLYVFRIGGEKYEVSIADSYERLIKQLGLQIGGSQKMNQVKAPMPGLVLSILVEPGQSVHKGDSLLILEAMKMENVIKASADATIKSIAVQKGNAVEKGQLLITFE
jgi:biotin carboxyl carrier protein